MKNFQITPSASPMGTEIKEGKLTKAQTLPTKFVNQVEKKK